jgi:glutamyl-tRNA synthetase
MLFENNKFNSDSLEEIEGFAEEAVSNLQNDEIIQFERFGFVRIEKQKDEIKAFFTHK